MGMDTTTGALRELSAELPVRPSEVEITAEEADVLDRYEPALRPQLLRQWRNGELVVDPDTQRFVPKGTTDPRVAEKVRAASDAWDRAKARKHAKAVARSKRGPFKSGKRRR